MAFGPCDWPVQYPGELEETTDLDLLQVAEGMAAGLLWNWTGRIYGLCELTVRPCRRGCDSPQTPAAAGIYRWHGLLHYGRTLTLACGVCGERCGCDYTESVALPYPTEEVLAVRENGQLLSASSYSLREGRYLVRVDGGKWPTCQDLNRPPGEPDTWEVDLLYGIPVPEGGQVAAGILAQEVLKALEGDASCGLPQRIQSVTRQGVTVAMMDDFSGLEDGKTGLWLVDSWVASVNRRQGGGRVYSPDFPARRYEVSRRLP